MVLSSPLLAGLLLLSFLAWRIQVWYRLRQVPGPKFASLSKYWLISHSLSGHLHLDLRALHDRYGPVIRIGPNDVVTDDFTAVRRMHGSQAQYTRSDYYDCGRLNPPHNNIISERKEARHAELRSRMAAGYSGRENHQLESAVNDQLLALFNLIDSKYISNETYRAANLGQLVQFFTMDVIGAVAFGKPFGFLENDKDMYDYLATTEKAVPGIDLVANLPILAKVATSALFRRFLMPSPKDKTWLGKMFGIAEAFVDSRYQGDSKDEFDMLGSFKRHGLTHDEAIQEVCFQILAGAGTTASAILATILHITTIPRVHNKLTAELETASQANHLSSPIITDTQARTLPYLQACIKEGLRIQPPSSGLALKQTPPAGDRIGNIPVPPGVRVGISSWAMQRNKAVFGPDADAFRPERWLEDGPRRRDMERSVELVFASGRYTCLGRPLALLELNKVFAEVFRRYEIGFVDPGRPWRCTSNAAFWVIKDMNVWITPRDNGVVAAEGAEGDAAAR